MFFIFLTVEYKLFIEEPTKFTPGSVTSNDFITTTW